MKYLPVLFSALLLAACGGDANRDDEDQPKGGVIGETYIDSLEKAEAVEDLATDRSDRLDDEIEAAEDRD